MNRFSTLVTVLAASTILAGAAAAADQAAAPSAPTHATLPAPHETTAQKSVDRDIVKLSTDGAAAFRDLDGARVAIFDADPDTAKALIGKARDALGTAKTDESIFVKAEADLKQPASAKSDATAKASTNKTPKSGDVANATSSTQPIAWLPIDGQLTLGEDFVATPQKSAAMSDANKSLAKGDQKGAVEKLKLAGVNVSYTMAVLPLEQTTSDVEQAAKLIDQGQYYQANVILKHAEDGMRFDIVDATAMPKTVAATDQAAKDAKPDVAPAGADANSH